jgi:type IV secretion system protein VirB6
MQSLTDMINGAADLALFSAIRSYVSTRIDFFLEHTLSGALTIVGGVVLAAFTVWIMIQGFLIVTGRSQDGLKGFLLQSAKAYLIILVATGLAAGQGFSVRTLTEGVMNSVAEVMAGDSDAAKCLKADASFLGCKVDRNLVVMQGAMNFAGQLDTADDPVLEDKKTRASWFIGVGTGGPAIVAGTMILMYKVAIALFIGLGPIFILCLLFKQTAPLFQKWLYYGIATIFASTLLAVMADICLDLIKNVAGALFVADLFGVDSQGLMQAATQQLGLGLMLSTLLITVPPMAGSFFNGVMGSFAAHNQLGGMPAPGSSAGQFGGGAAGAAGASGQTTSAPPVSQAPSTQAPPNYTNDSRVSTGQTASNYSADVVKSSEQSQTGNAARAYTPSPETPPPVSPDVRVSTPPKDS